MSNLTQDLARALGLPKQTTKAVLTLEVGKAPTLAEAQDARAYGLRQAARRGARTRGLKGRR